MKGKKTLILERKAIEKLAGIKEAIGAVERAFRYFGEGKVQMPPKMYITVDKHLGDFRAMPAYVEHTGGCGIKWVNVHPENRKKSLPTVMALIILSDPKTGFPLCVMDATYVTALRTGAAGGVAAKYLARKNSKKAALIGCGTQALTQLAALNEIFRLTEVNIWGCRKGETKSFIRKAGRSMPVKMQAVKSLRDCVEGCDIVFTTTPSVRPIVKSEWIAKGTHINAIGADAKGKEELDPAILKKAKVVVDDWRQASHSGEINVPLRKGTFSKRNIYADIGQIVAGKKRGRTKADEITVFDSTGLAIQDVSLADVIYRKAVRTGKGKYVSFI